MASTPTESDRPPPQSSSSRPPASRTRSNSDVDAEAGKTTGPSKSSRRSGGRRNKSSSDGVSRMMNQRRASVDNGAMQYQQLQQQNYQGQGNPPPSGNSDVGDKPKRRPRRMTRSSSDGVSRMMNQRRASVDNGAMNYQQLKQLSGNYGSTPPPVPPRRPTMEFSAMNELSSLMGAGGGGGKIPPIPPRRPTGASVMQQNLSYQGPHDTNYQGGPSMMRPDSFQGGPPLMRPDSYQGGAPPMRVGSHSSLGALGGEKEAFLAQQGGEGITGTPNKGARGPMLMRENSLENFMEIYKGEKQSKSFKDVLFGGLFFIQLACMLFAGAKFGPQALVTTAEELGPSAGLEDDDLVEYDSHVLLAYQNIMKLALLSGAFAMLVSAVALAFMMAMARRLVYVALVLSIGVSFVWGTVGIGVSPNSFVPVTGIVALTLTVGYMFVVWDRIPFASANLTTAVTGVRENLGLVGVALLFQFLALLTSVYICFTYVGLRNAMLNGELGDLDDNGRNVVLGLLVVSYLWTYQVLRHIVMVTVAGTIGSWWFATPSAIKETFLHATVYNFGSICYGSLFIGIVQVLRQFTEGLRPNREGSSLMCLYECSIFFQGKIVDCMDILADTFTPWAYPYIGLYHYGLKEAGHKANELFDKRGWSRIVTDDLITSVLFLSSLVIGGLTGCFAVVVQILNSTGLTSFGHPVYVSFMIGFMIGIVLSAVLFSIIDSSVSAVIVCFAGSPVEFHQNHPELNREMDLAWSEVWPGSLDTDDGGSGLA